MDQRTIHMTLSRDISNMTLKKQKTIVTQVIIKDNELFGQIP